ncbi:MAG: hypothetical protein IPG97_07565 [Microthrixaceae bacterium]|nr:hypothetical protein [Microthrixaceae bacterium]
MTSTGTDADVESRATLAAIHALGVLDAHDDPHLRSLAVLAEQMAGGSLSVWLRGPVPPLADGVPSPAALVPVVEGLGGGDTGHRHRSAGIGWRGARR